MTSIFPAISVWFGGGLDFDDFPLFLGNVLIEKQPANQPPPTLKMNGRILQIYRDSRRSIDQRIQLPTGAEANLQTLSQMAAIVREDLQFEDLGNFIRREIIGLDKATLNEQAHAAFMFCRDRIVYQPEQAGFETIADLWSCLYGINPMYPVGDCAIKSTALATCFAFIGLRPYFTAIRQTRNAAFFNHVFVSIRTGDNWIAFDPTPENFKPGDQLPYLEHVNYRIF